jgi:uncharacterized protein (UPF0335 family)
MTNDVGGIAADRLLSIVERIEHLEEEKNAISSDITDVYAEAKSAGFDVKILREVIKLRKKNVAERDEHELLLETYLKALDM